MTSLQSFSGIHDHFDALCSFVKHILQYESLSRPSADPVLTTDGVELVIDETPASYTSAISNSFRLYDRGKDVLLEYPIWLIFCWGRYVDDFSNCAG